MEPFDGRSLAITLERASRSGFGPLPAPLSAFIVARALEAHERTGQVISPETVLLAFEGGVALDAAAPAGDGVSGALALLSQLGTAKELARRSFGSARELREALEQWLATAAPGLTGEVLREVLGALFDGELLATGRLFISHAPARARLAQLRGSALPPAPVPAPVVAPPAQVPAKRQRPALVLGLAGLGACVAGLSGAVFWMSSRADAIAVPAPEATAKPMPVRVEPPPPQPVVAQAPPPEPATQPVSFDAEAAPLTLRLTQAHQTVVEKKHCFPVPKKKTVKMDRRLSAGVTVPRGGNAYGPTGSRGSYGSYGSYPATGAMRMLGLFGLFSPRRGPVQLVNLEEPTTFAEEGQICFFAPSDRSLEQETSAASVDIGDEGYSLDKALHVVDSDDRFRVRSFVPEKKWVVRVSDTTPPWPVLFVDLGRATEVAFVLDKPEISFTGPRSMWITVPVYEQVPYAREISIQLAPGERLKESAEDLLASGRHSLDIGGHGSAAATLDRCINAYPSFPGCHLALGDAFWELRYRDEARTQYREYLRLAPDGAERERVQKLLEHE